MSNSVNGSRIMGNLKEHTANSSTHITVIKDPLYSYRNIPASRRRCSSSLVEVGTSYSSITCPTENNVVAWDGACIVSYIDEVVIARDGIVYIRSCERKTRRWIFQLRIRQKIVRRERTNYQCSSRCEPPATMTTNWSIEVW